MTKEGFRPTTIVQHRYEQIDILDKCLQDFGYKKYQIEDKNRPGIQIQLPGGKRLSDEEIKRVHAAYMAEHKKKMNSSGEFDDD